MTTTNRPLGGALEPTMTATAAEAAEALIAWWQAEAREAYLAAYGPDDGSTEPVRFEVQAQLGEAESGDEKRSLRAAIKAIRKALSRPARASEPEPGVPPDALRALD